MCVFTDTRVIYDVSMAISNVAQFGLLLWKNWLLQKRRIVVTIFQIIIPTLLALFLLPICLLVDAKFVSMPTIWDSFDASAFPPSLILPGIGTAESSKYHLRWMLVFSPNTSEAARRIAAKTTEMLDMVPFPIGISLLFTPFCASCIWRFMHWTYSKFCAQSVCLSFQMTVHCSECEIWGSGTAIAKSDWAPDVFHGIQALCQCVSGIQIAVSKNNSFI